MYLSSLLAAAYSYCFNSDTVRQCPAVHRQEKGSLSKYVFPIVGVVPEECVVEFFAFPMILICRPYIEWSIYNVRGEDDDPTKRFELVRAFTYPLHISKYGGTPVEYTAAKLSYYFLL